MAWNRGRWIVLAGAMTVALMASPGALVAQQAQGDIEVQFTASVFSTVGQDEVSRTTALLQAKGGYFITGRIEVGAFPSLVLDRTRIRTGGVWQTDSETKVGFGVFSNYSFLMEDARTVPYLGAQFYRIDLQNEDEGGWLGATGGFKLYLNRNMAIDLGGNYLVGVGDSQGALILFQAGVSVLL